MSGKPRHKLVNPADLECSTCTADCPACAESGNQPEKGAEAVTGVAPRCTVCQSDRCRLNDGTYGACTYVLCPDPLADWCEERKTSIEAARNRMRAAPAPQPMSIENHGTPHWSSGAQPMSAEAFWPRWCKENLGLVRRAILQGLPALYAQFAEAYAAHRHAALIAERDVALGRLFDKDKEIARLQKVESDQIKRAEAAEADREKLEMSLMRANKSLESLRRLQGGEPSARDALRFLENIAPKMPAAPWFNVAVEQLRAGIENNLLLPAPLTAEPCKCTHLKTRHNFKAVGECMDCGCTGYVAAEPPKEKP